MDDAWINSVRALPAERQVQVVIAKLKELNPGFDGTAWHTIDNGVVITWEFRSDQVTDISPLRALAGLRTLQCNGSARGQDGSPTCPH